MAQSLQCGLSLLRIRPAQAEDHAFLFQLFAEAHKLHGIQPDGDLGHMLTQIQFRGRNISYAERYPLAEDSIVLDEDNRPVGRFLIDRCSADSLPLWRVVDIAILESHRGRGLAGSLLQQIQCEAAAAGTGLELQVAVGNPALRLYRRLGFRATQEDALGVEMAWP